MEKNKELPTPDEMIVKNTQNDVNDILKKIVFQLSKVKTVSDKVEVNVEDKDDGITTRLVINACSQRGWDVRVEKRNDDFIGNVFAITMLCTMFFVFSTLMLGRELGWRVDSSLVLSLVLSAVSSFTLSVFHHRQVMRNRPNVHLIVSVSPEYIIKNIGQLHTTKTKTEEERDENEERCGALSDGDRTRVLE